MGYRLRGRFISVLNDFDLSSIKRFLSSVEDAPKGFERTGTVPFMSLKLLVPDAIAGKVEHVYCHDAESFIWVLAWVCLRYGNGKLLRKNRPLDEWLTVDAQGCYKEKMAFLGSVLSMHPTPSHQKNFDVARQCLGLVYGSIGPFPYVPMDDEEVFRTWLKNHIPENILQGNLSSGH
ncbi:uncharacterized protein EDB93DRAFT_849741 [Suillus bovinus]|uniref:uncharacterized protein n=1 Tax=Suillus bovinus TaxID=48563 RepID=UPI001B882D5C|nr:uncharacterized protein EDB93DRAFT_849741 [Suillus bovinus]KAG2134182.1 hypothetical protein EDB93DRAFT_849741 [Suillus bovinus]